MNAAPDLSETYLYKIHALSNILDKIFDRTLQEHSNITLSQFMILLTISHRGGINQRQIAQHLEISAAAVKRQVDIAKRQSWLEHGDKGVRGNGLILTVKGQEALGSGLRALEKHIFQIFDKNNNSASLMQHINLLAEGAKEVLNKAIRLQ